MGLVVSATGTAEWWRPAIPSFGGEREEAATQPGPPAGTAGGETPFRAVMLFTFVLILAPQSLVPSIAALRPGLLTAAVALTAYLFDRLAGGLPVLRPAPELALSAALLAWSIATLPFSYWPGGSLAFVIDVFSKTLAIFWLLSQVVVTAGRLRQAAWGLTLMAVPLAAFGVREYVAGRFINTGAVQRIQSYDAPLTQNPNDLALMLNLILPLTLALLLVEPGAGRRLLLLACAAASLVAIVLTYSRAGFITLLVTIAIYAVRGLRRPGRGWALALLLLAPVGAALLPASYRERLATIADIQADPTGSAQERWGDTLAAARLVRDHPVVGAGIGMNVLALNEARGALWKKVHNVYLEYAVDLGLPGLVLFLLLLVGSLRAVTSVVKRTAADPGARPLFHLAEGVQVALVAFAVAALFHPVAYTFYFFYMAGLALGARAACDAGAFA